MSDSLDKVSWPIRTPRLVLRRLEAGDAQATWEYRKLPEVQRWITSGAANFEEYLGQFMAAKRYAYDVAVELTDANGQPRLIGTVMVKVQDGWGQSEIAATARGVEAEIGWSFNPVDGGQGYASEAVSCVLDLCFGPLGLRRVVAECFVDNEPSWRLMERIGMRREGYGVQSGLHREGQWLDSMSYAILADEWLARSERDQTLL